jgi:short-subunit dehydrogenase
MMPLLLTHALLPALRKAGDARILNMGSTFGNIGYPGYAPYCASKAGLRAFTEALRRELADTLLKVMYLAPRATQTTLNDERVVAMNKALGNAVDSPALVADAVADMIVRGNKNQLFIGWPEKLFARLNQLLPGIVDGALRKQLETIKRFARQL